MAEFLTMEEAKNHFASNGKGNAGLTLGIIGTALGALSSGVLGGNGILGLGGNNGMAQTAAGMAAGAAIANAHGNNHCGGGWYPYPGEYHPSTWDVISRETADQEFDLVKMGDIQLEGLKNSVMFREKDIAEKADIYRQTKVDNNVIQAQVSDLKDFTIKGLSDVYQASVKENQGLAKQISDNRYEGFKNVADLYAASNIADKNLELQIERNREIDQREKFDLYKNLDDKTNVLAYETMKRSYENKIDTMEKMAGLAERISNLETTAAVNKASLPLMFQLADANTAIATCRKIDGHLTIGCNQISGPVFPGPFTTNNTSGCNSCYGQ